MKKLLAIVIAAVLLAIPALAASEFFATEPAAEPSFFRAEYEGNGRVEIEFKRDMSYQNLSVEVLNPFGQPEDVTLIEVDDDDLTFSVADVRDETTYTFTVSGIREGRTGDFGAITGQFTTPGPDDVVITELEGDVEDGEIEIDFLGRVRYDNPAVTVTRADGTALDARITDRENDSIELRVSGLTRGEEYTVTVTGVAPQDSGVFGSVTRTFIAR